MGRRLGTGESVPFESFHHMEAFRSASRAAIGRRSDAHFLYWPVSYTHLTLPTILRV